MVQKNIGTGMLASVQLRYFEEYQIYFKTFEGFLNFSPVLSEISRDFYLGNDFYQSTCLSYQNGLITQDNY